MLVYFVVATVVALGLIVWALIDSFDNDGVFSSFFILLCWLVIVLLPSSASTARTIVERAQLSEYKILKVSPHCSVLTTGLDTDNLYSLKITNSYILYKIQTKQFKVIKHTHLNMWGNETHRTTYFVKGITK